MNSVPNTLQTQLLIAVYQLTESQKQQKQPSVTVEVTYHLPIQRKSSKLQMFLKQVFLKFFAIFQGRSSFKVILGQGLGKISATKIGQRRKLQVLNGPTTQMALKFWFFSAGIFLNMFRVFLFCDQAISVFVLFTRGFYKASVQDETMQILHKLLY